MNQWTGRLVSETGKGVYAALSWRSCLMVRWKSQRNSLSCSVFSPERWVLIPEPDRSHSRYVLVLLSTESDDILNAKDKTVNTAMYHFRNGVQCVRSLDWEVWRPQWHSAVHRTGPERAHLQWAFWQRRTAQNIPPYYTQRGRHGQHHGRKTTTNLIFSILFKSLGSVRL